MTQALEDSDALLVIPVFAGFQIAVACLTAEVVLLEMADQAWTRVVGYWLCLVLVGIGLYVVARRGKRDKQKLEEIARAAALAEGAIPKGLDDDRLDSRFSTT